VLKSCGDIARSAGGLPPLSTIRSVHAVCWPINTVILRMAIMCHLAVSVASYRGPIARAGNPANGALGLSPPVTEHLSCRHPPPPRGWPSDHGGLGVRRRIV
jgi:hypothetical protein